jgi:glycosyltransferase involved in cell wall biosynthesis
LVSGATFRRFESKYLNDLDALIVPSARDQRWLADRLSRPVVHVRNVADLEALSPVRAVTPSSMGLTVVFVGSLYEPNILGLRWFLHRVWPRVVAQVPQSRFLIVGRGIESGLFRRLPRGVRVVGSVPDVRPYLQEARVVVCPVFFGGGIPNKVLESAAGGRPTVVSPYVARTLGDTAGFAVADHPARWAEALVKYLSDPSAADADGLIAYRNVQANYSLSRWHDDMLRLEALVLA